MATQGEIEIVQRLKELAVRLRMLIHELLHIGAVIRDTKAYRARRVLPERLRDVLADLEHGILDGLLAMHDAQAEEQVPDDTTGSGCEQEARQRVQNTE